MIETGCDCDPSQPAVDATCSSVKRRLAKGGDGVCL